MKRVALVLAVFALVLPASSNAAPTQLFGQSCYYPCDEIFTFYYHWATTVKPFMVNVGYDGAYKSTMQLGLNAWNQASSLEGLSIVPYNSPDADILVQDIPYTGQTWAGKTTISGDLHGAINGSSSPQPKCYIEVVDGYQHYVKVYAHEIGHCLGFGHSTNINTDADEVMSYCWCGTDNLPGAEELAFEDNTIQNHLDTYTTLSGPEQGTAPPPPPPSPPPVCIKYNPNGKCIKWGSGTISIRDQATRMGF